jgi:hypothetical protein
MPERASGCDTARLLRCVCSRVFLENPKVTGCQKCQKPHRHPSGTFGTPLVSVSGETTRLRQSHTTPLARSQSLPLAYAEDFCTSVFYRYTP